jgi:hypothetical protein
MRDNPLIFCLLLFYEIPNFSVISKKCLKHFSATSGMDFWITECVVRQPYLALCREECAGSGMRLHTLPFADNNESAALFSSRGR